MHFLPCPALPCPAPGCRWIGFRLDLIASFTLLAGALLAVVMRDTLQPDLLGLALTHVLQLTGLMQWFVRQTAEVENTMTRCARTGGRAGASGGGQAFYSCLITCMKRLSPWTW